MDHIHKWCHHCSLYKIDVARKFFLDLFIKSLLPPFAKDIAITMPQNEDESILKA